ncbi:MAG: hypothetical protein LUG99_12970 [Lachnospiraceae bacterium]|nr:hypothetical protein [Lachnospiraceae bacterium]
MAEVAYTDIPLNIDEIMSFVVVDKEMISEHILEKRRCFFYDACSFRRHAKLKDPENSYLLKYMEMQDAVFIITKTVLMELASHSGILNREYVEYLRMIKVSGITSLLIYEEDLYFAMAQCFAANEKINECLIWAAREIKNPVSTIRTTMDRDSALTDIIIKGKNLGNGNVYERFFKTIRANKEPGDNLGEELIAICLYILSDLPGEEDGKYCVITDDRGAAGKFGVMFGKRWERYCESKISVFSTPRLVQVLKRENILLDREHIKAILSSGTDGNIAVLGMRLFDLKNNLLSLSCEELTDLIMSPNGIHIVF